MNAPVGWAAFDAWWELRCRKYLADSFGPVGDEIRDQIARRLFPVAAEPVLAEQTLPIAFVHLRLLAGEEMSILLKRLERLSALFGNEGAKATIGTVYLLLTSLTSTPGKLSSLSRGQSSFFSLLLRRVADRLDRGEGEEEIRRELAQAWEIKQEGAVTATLARARGLWRRMRHAGLGLSPLPFDLNGWIRENSLSARFASERRVFSALREGSHLAALAEQIAAAEAVRGALEAGEGGALRPAWEETRAALMENLSGGLEGLTPWEAEALRRRDPLHASLLAWAGRLRLGEGGETPAALPGRERLPDWLREHLQRGGRGAEGAGPAGVLSTGRFLVGGETYLVVGVDATASPEAARIDLAPAGGPEGEGLSIRLRFGGGEERAFALDLEDGKDLLAGFYLVEQPDIRLDILVRGEDDLWRFGASRYLFPDEATKARWLAVLTDHLAERFGGEEDRLRLKILQGVKG